MQKSRIGSSAASMARFLVALFAATVLAVQAGQLSHAAPSTAEVFWRAMLPDSPLPDAILRLLRPDTNFLSKAEANGAAQPNYPYIYQEYKRSPFIYNGYKGSGKRHGTTAGARHFYHDYKAPSKLLGNNGATEKAGPFLYHYKAPSKSHAGSGESDAASTARASGAATTTVFFHEEAVRVGERLPFYFPPTAPAALGFLPRRVADSIPFSTPSLPGVLALFGIAPDSVVAASMEETLRTCESPTLAGEAKFCATSLEALIELAMAALGTRDVNALTSTLPLAGALLQPYTVTAVRPVEGASFLACHDEVYPYTVYRCHTTGPARAYMVEMEGARGGSVTVATVCHTDTSRWNPEHVSFKLLGTKPGGSPVCHLMPYGHLIWAKNVKRSPA